MKSIDLNLTAEQFKDKYFPAELSLEEYKRNHMLMLAKSEELQRTNGEYRNLTKLQKCNCIERVNHYIEMRTPEERLMPEYQAFIDSMEKSLAIFKS